jgi:hypothetical protein
LLKTDFDLVPTGEYATIVVETVPSLSVRLRTCATGIHCFAAPAISANQEKALAVDWEDGQ